MRKKRLLLFFSIISFVFFSSCEGNRVANGYVKDQATDKVIDSVLVNVISASNYIYTDSVGYYFVSNDFGGCVPKCKDIEIEFSKKGYQTLKKDNPSENEIIYLTPKE